MHVDFSGAADLDAEVQRLISLGATETSRHEVAADFRWVVLADPDGNAFCVAAGHCRTEIADAVHDASIAYGRVWSSADDVANFSGGNSMSLYMELSNGLPAQTYAKINDGSGRNVAWGFSA